MGKRPHRAGNPEAGKEPHRRGFSLVEALVFISVLGVIAGIAIPFLGYLGNTAAVTKAKQNATDTAQVSGMLSAAGVEHVIPESMGGAEATTRLLRRGITVSEGALQGAYFGMPNLAEDEVPATAAYPQIVLHQTVLRMVYAE